jgi:PLP dependent protein
MNIGTIARNLNSIDVSIKSCAKSAGRDPNSVRLIAVTKTIKVADIIKAYDAGQRLFGENRVPELEEKKSQLPSDSEWHMIGHLQTNKVKSAVKCSHLIHSVDSKRLLMKINEVAGTLKKQQNILLQANIFGEKSKFGSPAEMVGEIVAAAMDLSHVCCKGFMTMAPQDVSAETLKIVFSRLRRLREEMEDRFGASFPELSMGMSGDYEVAIEEGATFVRIGSAIFGPRFLL